MNIINLALRCFQFLMSLLVMALIGDTINDASRGGNASIINYTMFCAVFGMLCLFYLIPAAIKDSLSIHPFLPAALDVLLALFWFCGAVALAAKLGVHSCNNDDYTSSNGVINAVVGHGARYHRCTEAQASDAFLWFGFAAFAASAVLSGLGAMGGGGSKGAGGIRARGPAMSQV